MTTVDHENAAQSLLEAAATASGWKREQITITPEPELDQGGCKFFSVVNTQIFDVPGFDLAVLPNGQILSYRNSEGSSTAAATILKQCGKDASPEWWAEVIVRFSGKASGRVVKSQEQAFDVEEIQKHGATFSPPALKRNGNATSVDFFTIQYEPARAFAVHAQLSDQGELSVVNKPVSGN